MSWKKLVRLLTMNLMLPMPAIWSILGACIYHGAWPFVPLVLAELAVICWAMGSVLTESMFLKEV